MTSLLDVVKKTRKKKWIECEKLKTKQRWHWHQLLKDHDKGMEETLLDSFVF